MSRRRGVWTARCPPDGSRRSTPERLYTAHRAATINRLIGEGELPDPCRGEGGRLEGWNGLRRPTAGRSLLGRRVPLDRRVGRQPAAAGLGLEDGGGARNGKKAEYHDIVTWVKRAEISGQYLARASTGHRGPAPYQHIERRSPRATGRRRSLHDLTPCRHGAELAEVPEASRDASGSCVLR